MNKIFKLLVGALSVLTFALATEEVCDENTKTLISARATLRSCSG